MFAGPSLTRPALLPAMHSTCPVLGATAYTHALWLVVKITIPDGVHAMPQGCIVRWRNRTVLSAADTDTNKRQGLGQTSGRAVAYLYAHNNQATNFHMSVYYTAGLQKSSKHVKTGCQSQHIISRMTRSRYDTSAIPSSSERRRK
jgi:hypothetical protein